ncbi:MAG TPA: AbrB/MazE/SpoVT family DNA-binding domain-containing protein [Thermoanaerobaculia bacterium]|nr:AbrB/MazE/SpoVT family DNA-binding domain-containing protein [Thermoanaerobaculia bacterium]
MRGTISSKGQVTVPIEIRKQLGLVPGTSVEFEIREKGVLLRKGISGTHPVDQVWGTLRLGRPVDEILDEMRGTSTEESVRLAPSSSAPSETLDALSTNFESLLEHMQARKGLATAFNATPEALGQAAAKAARRRSQGTSWPKSTRS